MAHVNKQNITLCVWCLANKAKCYKKMHGPSCYWCYMKKGGCSLAQGRRTKEDEDDTGPAAGHQEWVEELLEELGKKMDEIMEVLRIGLEKIAEKNRTRGWQDPQISKNGDVEEEERSNEEGFGEISGEKCRTGGSGCSESDRWSRR